MNASIQHIDVGAYVLGLLEEPDRRAFEAHLSTCMQCHEELAVLRGVAATLDGLSPIEEPAPAPPTPDPAVVTDMLRYRERADRRRRRSGALVGAAAGIVLLAGAFGAGLTMTGDDKSPSPAPPAAAPPAAPAASVEALLQNGHHVSATDAATGVSGTVAMEGKGWGSRVGLKLGKVKGPLECTLVAIDRAGNDRTVSGWSVPPKGYGFADSPAPALTLEGGTALKPNEITRFEVRDSASGRILLKIPTV
ncbi:zf-HC2 domain-containing protein [Actinomadura barringtoniae]|uniref:Zf-HC2 domain-containing protein n=1 Tax=Actinomadura barringtoniae TaxID=1427535 RepID=A0A939PJ61_9ACTN|nr:zf-HC2 domain-containing protein [Actinomadura barringtoniae]MBO2451038.1 zf-HC2 domain-containing protein [Actinomadura barringtoniae]